MPPALLLYYAAARRRLAGWEALDRPGRPWASGSLRALIAAVPLLLALGGPRWGTEPDRVVAGRDIIFAIDASLSMAAQDAVPNRLGLAIEAARGWIAALDEGDRVGVVAFAGRGVPRCPLTDRHAAAVDAIEALRPGEISPGGSDLEAAILAALDLARDPSREASPIIVVISDGEVHSEGWRRLREPLGREKATVHAIAVGDAGAGHPIPMGEGEDLRDSEGSRVLTRRQDLPLRSLAEWTGGRFIALGTAAYQAADVFRSEVSPGLREHRIPGGPADRFGLFAAGATLALAFPIPRRHPRGRLGLFLLGAIAIVGAGSPSGETDFREGHYPQALAIFEGEIQRAPGQPIPLFNAGVTLIRLGRIEDAERMLLRSRELATPPLRGKIDYALGNVRLALGDPEGAIRRYDESLVSLPAGDILRDDAIANRAFATECRSQPEAKQPPDRDQSAPRKEQEDRAQPPPDKEEAKQEKAAPPPGATPTASERRADDEPRTPEEQLDRTWERIQERQQRRNASTTPKVIRDAGPIW